MNNLLSAAPRRTELQTIKGAAVHIFISHLYRRHFIRDDGRWRPFLSRTPLCFEVWEYEFGKEITKRMRAHGELLGIFFTYSWALILLLFSFHQMIGAPERKWLTNNGAPILLSGERKKGKDTNFWRSSMSYIFILWRPPGTLDPTE